MNTVVLTPLFPPDTSDSSRYTKELAKRIPAEHLSIIAYGRLHESVPNVTIYPISKRSSKVVRLFNCLRALWRLKPDILIVQNGPSTELPAVLFSFLSATKLIYIVSDKEAAAKRSLVKNWFEKRADKIITLPDSSTTYLPREWLPFTDDNPADNPDEWWDSHLQEVNTYYE